MTQPNTSEIENEDRRWSLSWHPDGRSNSFTREAILTRAPRASGVYGLFNFDCQIFIGETANIQEALLRHERETDFQSRHLRPTGFTFETCPGELRKAKADELIARFHPVLQREAGLADNRIETAAREMRGTSAARQMSDRRADGRDAAAHERRTAGTTRRRRLSSRHARVRRAVLLAAIVVAASFLALPSHNLVPEEMTRAGEILRQRISSAQSFVPLWLSLGLGWSSESSAEPSREFAFPRGEPPPANSENLPPRSMKYAAKPIASSQNWTDIQNKARPLATAAKNLHSNKKWSVQVAAAPAKEIADALARRLTAEGFAGYVVPVEVKGKTFYRVRVGPFNGQEEAQSARQSLAQQEGFRDAFVAADSD